MQIWLLLSIAVLQCLAPTEGQEVKVTVYYEAHCPFSRSYINTQLRAAYDLLDPIMSIIFVPVSFQDANGNIFCQHGESECVDNKYMACALKLYGEEDPRSIKYVFCMMSGQMDSSLPQKCTMNRGLDFTVLQKCYNSQQGTDFILEFSRKSKQAGVPLFPYVLINGYTDPTQQGIARENPGRLICAAYRGKNPPKPAACKNF